MRSGQHTHLAGDRPNVLGAAPVGPLAVLQDLRPHQLFFEALEQLADGLRVVTLRREVLQGGPAQVTDGGLAIGLARAEDGLLEVLAQGLDALLFERFVPRWWRGVLLGLTGRLAQLVLSFDDRL